MSIATLVVRVAVDLHDQRYGRACEVGDVRADAMLPTEAEAEELIAAQMGPQLEVGGGKLLAHFSRARDEDATKGFAIAGSARGHVA
jgi:hypothetical protein